MQHSIATELGRIAGGGHTAAMATLLRVAGSTPQQVGARLLLCDDGTMVGTVGGGAVEHRVIELLRDMINGEQAHATRVESFDLAAHLGMCCGGRMEFLFERIVAPPKLVVIGAGHVGAALLRAASDCGFSLVAVDEREALLATLPANVLCKNMSPSEALGTLAMSDADFVVIATHDHQLDGQALAAFGLARHRYLGLIGSKRKILRVLARVQQRTPLPHLDRFYGPIGLDIGAVTPGEIAVAILAEMLAVRRGHTTTNMRLGESELQRLVQNERV